MPTRNRPSPEARRQREYRRRQREGLLHAVADVPLRHAEWLVEVGLLPQQEATNPRALGTALVNACAHLLKKIVTP